MPATASRMSETSDLLLGTPITSSPSRRAVLLRLAQADGQPWTEDQPGSGWNDHMAEVMFGTAADIVEAIVAERLAPVIAATETGWVEQIGGGNHRVVLASRVLAAMDDDAPRRHNKRVWWQGYNSAERDDATGVKTITKCPYGKGGRHV